MRRLAPGEGFAATLQEPRKTFWCLQERCKCPEKLFGVCGSPANGSANAGSLAQPAQTSRQMPGASRGLRKRLGKCRGTCAACANVSVNAGSLAQPAQTSRRMPGTPQVPRKTFWCLRESRKHFQKRFSPLRVIRRTSLLILCLPRTHVISVKACRAGTFLLLLRGQKTDGLTDKHKKENGKDFSGIRHGKRRLRSAYL